MTNIFFERGEGQQHLSRTFFFQNSRRNSEDASTLHELARAFCTDKQEKPRPDWRLRPSTEESPSDRPVTSLHRHTNNRWKKTRLGQSSRQNRKSHVHGQRRSTGTPPPRRQYQANLKTPLKNCHRSRKTPEDSAPPSKTYNRTTHSFPITTLPHSPTHKALSIVRVNHIANTQHPDPIPIPVDQPHLGWH